MCHLRAVALLRLHGTVTDPGSSDGEVEIVEITGPFVTKVKKRKGGDERDVMGRGEAGPSTKRPRHSVSGIGLNEANQSES